MTVQTRFQGAIFDVDGVLVDSPHEAAWRDGLRELMEGDWSDVRDQSSWAPERFTPQVYQQVMSGKPRMSGALAALEYFERALLRDSSYALAYAGIGLVWGGRAQMGIGSIREAQQQASAAARQALLLDSTLAEVQYAVASIRTWSEWDWAGAETAFQKAIGINPNYPDARAFYSHFLSIMGRPEEARAQMDSAVALDPLNSQLLLFIASSLHLHQLIQQHIPPVDPGAADQRAGQYDG